MQTVLDAILRRFITFGRLAVTWPDGSQTSYGNEDGGPHAAMRLRDKRSGGGTELELLRWRSGRLRDARRRGTGLGLRGPGLGAGWRCGGTRARGLRRLRVTGVKERARREQARRD